MEESILIVKSSLRERARSALHGGISAQSLPILTGGALQETPLESETLARAMRCVKETQNTPLITALRETAAILLGPIYKASADQGYTLRERLGLHVIGKLKYGHLVTFCDLVKGVDTLQFTQSARRLETELGIQHKKNGYVFSEHSPEQRPPTGAYHMPRLGRG